MHKSFTVYQKYIEGYLKGLPRDRSTVKEEIDEMQNIKGKNCNMLIKFYQNIFRGANTPER